MFQIVGCQVSYTQKRKDVSKLAEEYILYSNGDIKAVIGLDMDYSAAKDVNLRSGSLGNGALE